MVMPKKASKASRYGGPWYGRMVPRGEVALFARPARETSGWVWWASGSDNWGVNVREGVLPFELAKHLAGHLPPPPGMGGRWYATEADALAALKHALELTERQTHF